MTLERAPCDSSTELPTPLGPTGFQNAMLRGDASDFWMSTKERWWEWKGSSAASEDLHQFGTR